MPNNNPPMIYSYDQADQVCRRQANDYVATNIVLGGMGGAALGGSVGSLGGSLGGAARGIYYAPRVHDECMQEHGHEPRRRKSKCTIL